MTWTTERTETLKRLWAQGLGGAQIARLMGGVTREAVVGKVHRLKLGGREKPTRPPRITAAPEPKAEAQPQEIAPPKPVKPLPASPSTIQPSLQITILDRARGQCAYATGQNARGEHVFCGHPVRAGSSYCAAHHAACHDGKTAAQAGRRKPKSQSDLDAIDAIRRRSVGGVP